MGEPSRPSDPSARRESRGKWSSLFQAASVPVFLLSRRRQLRYVNPAWEALAGVSSDTLRGQFCLPRKTQGTQAGRALLQALAPPPEAMQLRTITIRRPVPPAKIGPPWWEITFVPLDEKGSLSAVVGFIRPVETAVPAAPSAGLSEPMMALRVQAAARFTFEHIPGSSQAVQRLVAQGRLASTCREPVWISGERGTGKEFLARTIHFQGTTMEHTFLAIDSAGLQPYLIRAMLFGRAGQATASLGTVYLKNAAALPRELQAEIVAWVEELEQPPRIVVGVREGALPFVEAFETAFRVLEIRIPSLRERRDDLPAVIESLRRGSGLPEISPSAAELLLKHDWPGNLRELNAVFRAAASQSGGGRIEPSHLPLGIRVGDRPSVRPMPPLDSVLEEVERRMLTLALQTAKGNKSEAADQLGIPRARLLRRLEALEIDPKG